MGEDYYFVIKILILFNINIKTLKLFLIVDYYLILHGLNLNYFSNKK